MTGILALDICVALALIAGGVTVVWKAVVFLNRLGDVSDDWFGEMARPGVPGRAGVMARLGSIEDQLHPNHGSSMRDAIDRMESTVLRLEHLFDEHINNTGSPN